MKQSRGWSRRSLFGRIAALAAAAGALPAARAAESTPHRCVYHLDDTARAIAAFRNLENHHKAYPSARLVVVALGDGIDFLLAGAKDPRGNPYEPMIDDRVVAGVEFRICAHTLQVRAVDRAKVHPDAVVVASGAAEIARLQCEEGFAYYKP